MKRSTFLKIFFFILDLLILNCAYLLAERIFPESVEEHYNLRYQQYFFYINSFWILITFTDGLYTSKYIAYFDGFLKRTLRAFVFCITLILVYIFLPRRIEVSRMMAYASISLFFIGLTFNRLIYLGLMLWVRQSVDINRKVLIVGYNKLSKKLAAYLEKDAFGIKIMGYVDDSPKEETSSKIPIFRNIKETLKLAKRLRVNEIYSTIMPENNAFLYNIMKDADTELIRFRLVPDFCNLIDLPIHIDFLQDLQIFTLRREPLENLFNKVIKRTFDIVVSFLIAIFILSWLIPLLGLLIKLESRGPIFFIQLRSGINNRPFRCYKFRSMVVSNIDQAAQATKNDVRVTRLGRIMRKTSLDEFPQFINVLLGNMSIVGPRPHMLKHTKSFANVADNYMIRQFLKPGITGWAQVNGFRGEITELTQLRKRVASDLWYLEHWNLLLDIKIMFMTVLNVFKGEKSAY